MPFIDAKVPIASFHLSLASLTQYIFGTLNYVKHHIDFNFIALYSTILCRTLNWFSCMKFVPISVDFRCVFPCSHNIHSLWIFAF